MEDMLRNPVELLDEDLDVVAGGGLALGIGVDINVAAINQLIVQVEVLSHNAAETGANVVTVHQ